MGKGQILKQNGTKIRKKGIVQQTNKQKPQYKQSKSERNTCTDDKHVLRNECRDFPMVREPEMGSKYLKYQHCL